MKYRDFGSTGWKVSSVSFGAWAIGGSWGTVEDKTSVAALNNAIDLGVNLIDTADVYGDGRSEKLIGQVLKSRKQRVYVATKAGRRLSPHTAEGYTLDHLRAFVDRSRVNLQMDVLDLLQLHCPPSAVYGDRRVFDALDQLVQEKRITYYGISVETVQEAMSAIAAYPTIKSVQIILNLLRQKPTEYFLPYAKQQRVAVLARVPLASGMLTGRIRPDTIFAEDDHRHFNREGKFFDVGETFSGVPVELGMRMIERMGDLRPPNVSIAQMALGWCLAQHGVSTVIPGAKSVAQVDENVMASGIEIDPVVFAELTNVYNQYLRAFVHHRW